MKTEATIDEDFTARELCPDDTCIGVLSPEGVCGECGAIEERPESARARQARDSGVDLLHRTLCPDGACVGILGSDGRCKECGRVGSAVFTDPRLRGLKDESPASTDQLESSSELPKHSDEAAENEAVDEERVEAAEEPEAELPEGFAQRQLCPDGACIGVIGSSGTCNECGTVG